MLVAAALTVSSATHSPVIAGANSHPCRSQLLLPAARLAERQQCEAHRAGQATGECPVVKACPSCREVRSEPARLQDGARLLARAS